ncbi:MAG: RDD family protein [Hyphomicrobiales bacterium]|nr:RDD family protein [Hyphomicrobiales bacterium]
MEKQTPANSLDRIEGLLGARARSRRVIVSPEGVPLRVEIADIGERLAAFVLDMFFWLGASILFYLVAAFLLLRGSTGGVAVTLCLFLAFLLRNAYFAHFELAWQGSTPGKRICGLKAIDREGGPLTPAAVVARNLTREVEVFVPLGLMLSLSGGAAVWETLSLLAWVLVISCLPLFNRDRLRAGDIIAGTMVIALPRHALASELARTDQDYRFTHAQLQAYGSFELQVLEELLRRPDSSETRRTLDDVASKICRRIGWADPVPHSQARRFLEAFYTAERDELERGQLFGRYRPHKNSPEASRAGAS